MATNDLEESYFGAYYRYVTWFNIALIANSVLGLIIFEWAWF